ncbi:MAG: YfhO family protein [Candidatus Levybacteria bacterium]|nr:YfhO family protein [Candidatus Levybacteria bacterium]
MTTGSLPLKTLLASDLKNHQLPLWSEKTYAGHPVLAETTTGALFPLSITLFYLFPTNFAYNLEMTIVFFLTGFFTYIFCRSIKLSNQASLFPSLAFTFSGFFITHIINDIILDAIVWFPLSLFLIEKLYQTLKLKYSIFLGIIFSFQILSGNAQMAFYCIFISALYFLFKLFFNPQKKKLYPLFCFSVAIVIAFSLSAIQLIPTFEYLKLSNRSSGLKAETIEEFPYHPQELITFILPNIYGNPRGDTYNPPFPVRGIFWENTAYVGILTLILALLSILKIRKNNQIFFYFLLVFSLLLALGKYSPLNTLLLLPPFNFFRIPSRFLFFSSFSLIILAGLTMDMFLKKIKSIRHRYIIGAIITLIVLTDLFIFGYNYNSVYSAKQWTSPSQTAEFIKQDLSFFRIYNIDLSTNYKEHPFRKARLKANGWSSDLKPYYYLLNWIIPKTNLTYGLNHAGATFALNLKRSEKFDLLIGENILELDGNEKKISPLSLKLLSLLGIKYFISPDLINQDNIILKFSTNNSIEPTFRVYENTNVLPHAFLVSNSKVITDENHILNELKKENFDPLKTVILEKQVELNTKNNLDIKKDKIISITEGKNGNVKIKAQTSNPSFLVLTDTYYPGWKAIVNGKEEEILKADYRFRAIKLNPGENNIEFIYDPLSFKIGAVITGTTILFIIAFFLFSLVRCHPARLVSLT